MKRKVVFVGEERLGLLFKNFDIDFLIVKNSFECLEKVSELCKDNIYKVILTSEEYIESLQGFIEKRKAAYPVIFMLPGASFFNASANLIRDVVEKAVGIDILSKSKT